jgi:hypothetical protein
MDAMPIRAWIERTPGVGAERGAVSRPDSAIDRRAVALNAGSSALRFGLFILRDDGMPPLATGEAFGFGSATCKNSLRQARGLPIKAHAPQPADHCPRSSMHWPTPAASPAPRAIGRCMAVRA